MKTEDKKVDEVLRALDCRFCKGFESVVPHQIEFSSICTKHLLKIRDELAPLNTVKYYQTGDSLYRRYTGILEELTKRETR